jgi:hypothetical protein
LELSSAFSVITAHQLLFIVLATTRNRLKMHFWIDKRSSYGMGHNRNVHAGFSYQNRRLRSKALMNPVRNPIPSGPKHNQRNRQTDHEHQSRPTSIPQQSRTQPRVDNISQIQSIPTQYVPVVHNVYENILTPPVQVGSPEIAINHWLPVKIICAICILLATILLILKLYFDNEMMQLSIIGMISLVLLICILTISILRMRRNHILARTIHDFPVANRNQMIVQPHGESAVVPPPSYGEIFFGEKQILDQISTPPPSYETINIT